MNTVLASCCFAPVSWYAYAIKYNAQIIDIHEHYPKQTYRNRFDILGPNGKQTLTIPIQRLHGEKKPIKDVRLSEDKWRKLHMRSIKTAYGKSAFYFHFEDSLEHLFENTTSPYLIDFNAKSFELFESILQLPKMQNTKEFVDHSLQRQFWEPAAVHPEFPTYPQVFMDRFSFQSNLSILDVAMNLGQRTKDYLYSASEKITL